MDLPQRRTLTARALKAYALATPEDRAEGESWYRDARRWVRNTARETGHSTDTVARVTAALSPRLFWGRNKTVARALLDSQPISGVLKQSVVNALAALAGGQPGNGPKVNAFAQNLRGDYTRVTVDVWVLRALGLDEAADQGLKARQYATVESAVQVAADKVGIPAAIFQATLWVAARGKAE